MCLPSILSKASVPSECIQAQRNLFKVVGVDASPMVTGGVAGAVGVAVVTAVVDGQVFHECSAMKPVRSSMYVFVLTVETDTTVTSHLVCLPSPDPARTGIGCQRVFVRQGTVLVDPCQQTPEMVAPPGTIHISARSLPFGVETTETSTAGPIFAVAPRTNLRRVRGPSGIAMAPPHVVVVSTPSKGNERSVRARVVVDLASLATHRGTPRQYLQDRNRSS